MLLQSVGHGSISRFVILIIKKGVENIIWLNCSFSEITEVLYLKIL